MIRHAEAEGNLYRRIHGQYDSRVTVGGLRQIDALQQRFSRETIDVCYASDLLRTRMTASAIYLPKGLPLQLDPRFREVRLGVWEDVPFGQMEAQQPELMKQFGADPLNWSVEGSERFAEYSQRFLDAMTEAAAANDGKTIAIFSHGCVIRSMQQRLFFPQSNPREVGHCDNTGVSLLEYENGAYRAVYLNDNSHLTREQSTLAQQKWWRKGGADQNLWFRPLQDHDRFCQCRQALWTELYGPLPDEGADAFFRQATQCAQLEPDSLAEAVLGNEFAGLLHLDPMRHADDAVGYISFFYLLPQYRGQRLGQQLLGHAVSFYRARGRKKLWLAVSARNELAQRFYSRNGFRELGTVSGQHGPLLQMELPIDLEQRPGQ